MGVNAKGVVVKPLLLVGGQSSRMGSRKELLPFPDGKLAFEHAVHTLHRAVPSATTIYISLHDDSQLEGIQFCIRDFGSDLYESPFPQLKLIFDDHRQDIGPAAGLLAAHSLHPEDTYLVIGCDYPLLPPSALQQLVREYKFPVTCFVNASGYAEPLLAIWAPEALKALNQSAESGRYGLNGVIKKMGGNLVKPLREQWILGTNTREDWDEAMKILALRASDINT